MIRYIYAENIANYPKLSDSMFRDRAQQFRDRLNWQVTVDENGFEKDEYDALNPLYIIWEAPNGLHGGSMRILPTVGQTLINDHFVELNGGVKIISPLVWECTRFCLSSRHLDEAAMVASHLMLAGCELGLRFGLEHSVGVFDARMVRIYRRIGWSPDVLGSTGKGRDRISVGLWPITEEARDEMCRRSGVTKERVANWFDTSFPVNVNEMVA